MESRDSSPPRLVNERVYVAVGSDVEESRLTLQWALENFGADFGIIHLAICMVMQRGILLQRAVTFVPWRTSWLNIFAFVNMQR
ncbi:hypothetical protein CRG98_049983 [Punica granatum]|uniref:Uncharacterized protein n=1 Tax=Punica granatum TaxID=22663 RepID=A0A2I0H1D5_PUNGR|nr:hypothetical protein CRG98_049983 [Punica granatum]